MPPKSQRGSSWPDKTQQTSNSGKHTAQPARSPLLPVASPSKNRPSWSQPLHFAYFCSLLLSLANVAQSGRQCPLAARTRHLKHSDAFRKAKRPYLSSCFFCYFVKAPPLQATVRNSTSRFQVHWAWWRCQAPACPAPWSHMPSATNSTPVAQSGNFESKSRPLSSLRRFVRPRTTLARESYPHPRKFR